MKRFLVGLIVTIVVLAPLVAIYQQSLAAKRAAHERSGLLADIKASNAAMLRGVQELLDRPVVSVRTIRRVVNQHGVRKVIITRLIFRQSAPRIIYRTKIVYRTRIVYRTKIVYVCRLPNGHACSGGK